MLELTSRETWTVIHGLVLGTLFLLAFAGGLAGLWSLRPGLVTTAGIKERMTRLYYGTGLMAVVAWATVVSGTWIVYPWYRVSLAKVGEDTYAGCAGAVLPGATCSPRDFLNSNVSGNTEAWHTFGMEWKEHVAWLAPLLATAVAAAVTYYGVDLIKHQNVRRGLMVFFTLSVVLAGIAGLFGALITKVQPVL